MYVILKHLLKIGIKFILHETHHFNHFKVCNSVVSNLFTLSCNHPHFRLPEHFVIPKEKSYDNQAVNHYFPIILTAPGNLTPLSVFMVLLTLHIS